MPCDYKDYPADWKEISRRIREERAGNCCETCGIENYRIVRTNKATCQRQIDQTFALQKDYGNAKSCADMLNDCCDDGKGKWYPVVLTVAHIGATKPDGSRGDKHDKHDVRDENLKAECQRCHLKRDLNDHVENRRNGRNWRRNQQALFG